MTMNTEKYRGFTTKQMSQKRNSYFSFANERREQTQFSGFTLIELLVVIAIIGILSAVVLASLGTARQKGSDAAAKENLIGSRSQGELFFYANGNSYTNVCGPNPAPGGVKSINGQVLAAAQAEGLGVISVNSIGAINQATCNASATGWAAEVPLKAPTGGFFCVNSAGNATTTTTFSLTTAADITCG